MRVSNHAFSRMEERHIDDTVARIMEMVVPAKYLNHSYHLFLNRKNARKIASFLRKAANKVERLSGVQLVVDDSGINPYYCV